MKTDEKAIKKYENAVRRRLNLPKTVKDRVMSDFHSSVAARLEAGQTMDQVVSELGTPAKAAADLNEQMKEFAYRKSPWRFVFLGIAAIVGAKLLFEGAQWLVSLFLLRQAICSLSPTDAASIGIIGGSDGPTAIFVTRPGWVTPVMTAVILLVCLAIYYWLGHRKR